MTEFSALRQKEVIDVESGNRLGYIADLALCPDSGRILALLLPPKAKLFGFLGKEPCISIPWNSIVRMGDDVILVCPPKKTAENV